MDAREKLQKDLQAAMKAGDAVKRETLRTLLTALTNAEVEKKGALDEDDVVKLVQREAKKRREAIEAFTAGGRADRAEKEAQELAILESYLPAQLGEAEIEAVVREVVAGLSAPSMGAVMGAAMGRLKGKADGNAVRQVVARVLGASR